MPESPVKCIVSETVCPDQPSELRRDVLWCQHCNPITLTLLVDHFWKSYIVIKLSIRPTRVLWLWYLYNIYNCIQTKEMNSDAFLAMKSSFKFPASVTPSEVDHVMKDWWRMTSLQEPLKASCFQFACLTAALFHQLQYVCFFVDENSSPLLKQQRPELAGFGNSWLDVTTHSETQSVFHSTKNSGVNFRKFPWANGTDFSSVENNKPHSFVPLQFFNAFEV